MHQCVVQQQTIPPDFIGPLVEYAGDLENGAELESRLAQHGYVLLRGVLDRDEVLAAREEVFSRLEEVGEIKPPVIEGIATGTSRREEIAGGLDAFWHSVSDGSALRQVTHGEKLRKVMDAVLGETSRPHDMMYLRPCAVGYSTRMHYDYPFFAGRSNRIHTAWVPMGDIPTSDGPLVVVENSHHFDDLVGAINEVDYQSDRSNATVQQAAYDKQTEVDPVTLVRQRGTRLLSSYFEAGDVMVFIGQLMHGSLDNCSPLGRVRLSCDVRYQPASDPADDERYFGTNPRGSNGGGYGDMRGAKPLGEPA